MADRPGILDPDPVFLRADRQAGRAGGGQRLRLAGRRAVAVAVHLRSRSSVASSATARISPADPAGAAVRSGSGIIVDAVRASSSPTITSSPTSTRSRWRSATGASSTARWCSATSAPTLPSSASRVAGAELPYRRIQRFRPARGRRPGARHRRSLRRRPDRDQRHRLGAGANPGRRVGLPVLHPDRRRHQSRQLRRTAGRHVGPDRRHQHRDLFPHRRFQRHRLRHPLQHGAGRRRIRQDRRRPCPDAVDRRPLPGGDAGHCRRARARDAARRAGDRGRAGEPGARAGLKTGDLIVSVDGVEINDPTGINYRLATKGIGGDRHARRRPRRTRIRRQARPRGGAGDGAPRRDRDRRLLAAHRGQGREPLAGGRRGTRPSRAPPRA